ncbi:YihY/virulence factor BrkB family protein [Ornithinimicrobium cerasi]|uniref:YihY/virulence factor BrkB family protein n=1 Tax=Ornithinimicrobium cerasi TaxID=2248773 RepID=UPI000EFE9AF4|nr:YihY/virulence factor BrkB family protein [Ornithinimicrobium cerasi]
MTDQHQEARQTVSRAKSSEEFHAADDQAPDGPTDLPAPDWKATLKRTVAEFGSDGGTDLAAALTYYSVLSMFPMLIAFVSVIGLFGNPTATVSSLLDILDQMGAGTQLEAVRPVIENLASSEAAGLAFVLGLLGALWAASNYVNAFSRAMNAIYEVEEGRPVWKLRPWLLLLTFVILIMIVLVAGLLVLSGSVSEVIFGAIGLSGAFTTVWNIAKWPVMFVVVVLIVALLYWGTPNVRPPSFRWVSPGAILAIVVWAIASAGFGFYVSNFGSYNETYGTLAGVVVLLLWLWLTNVALIFGAEFDAELERGRELAAGMPAEEVIQLPPRDARGTEKKAEKSAALVREARELRMTAAGRLRGAGRKVGLKGRGRD